MGACCCCSKKRTTPSDTPAYCYGRRASEERVPLSSQPGAAAAVSTGHLVDTNLDTSIPDTYRPPPLPLPFNVGSGDPQTLSAGKDIDGTKKDSGAQATESDSIQNTVGNNATEFCKSGDLKQSDSKVETNSGVDSLKSVDSFVSAVVVEEDVCPICLEEYDADNPKMFPKCEHHFHLACILEWMGRSENCPVCDQKMVFESPIN